VKHLEAQVEPNELKRGREKVGRSSPSRTHLGRLIDASVSKSQGDSNRRWGK